jgi:hypothetical protein
MPHGDPHSPGAERTRLWRQRKRDGAGVVRFPVTEDEIEWLVSAGYLDGFDRENWDAIRAAVHLAFSMQCMGWASNSAEDDDG